jgi:hypothetical protein
VSIKPDECSSQVVVAGERVAVLTQDHRSEFDGVEFLRQERSLLEYPTLPVAPTPGLEGRDGGGFFLNIPNMEDQIIFCLSSQ